MNKGMIIKAHGNKIHVTPPDDGERETLVTMYTRVNVIPKVVRNTYIFSREDWYKVLKKEMEI